MSTEPGETGGVTHDAESRLWVEQLRSGHPRHEEAVDPEKLTITIDGEKLAPAPGQNVIAHGPDRNLSVDEIGGIELVGDAAATEA